MSERILVVAAHPDDEVLGCGGTIARLVDEGKQVFVTILGEGITSRQPEKEKANLDALDRLHASSREVGKHFGLADMFFYHLPDNRFDSLALLNIIKILEKLINQVRPQVIYTHHAGDLNIDHKLTHRAVLTAARPLAGGPVKTIYAFEVPSASDWAFGQFAPVFRPNIFVDIGNTLEAKLKAMQLYDSELQPFPHPRSLRALRAIARRWGSVAGVEAAEAFELIRKII